MPFVPYDGLEMTFDVCKGDCHKHVVTSVLTKMFARDFYLFEVGLADREIGDQGDLENVREHYASAGWKEKAI